MDKVDLEDHGKLDKAKFEKLFAEFYPYLCSFAKKYVDDIDACKDIVHNVFLNLWDKRDILHTKTSLKSYLFTSVNNRCLNYIRDNKKIVKHDLPIDANVLSEHLESTDYLELTELEMRIKKAVDGLPETCRRVFTMSRFEEMKYAEIAKELGVSVKAIEAQMSKALRILRTELSDYLVMVLIILMFTLG